MPQFTKSCQHIAYRSIGFPKSFKSIPMHSTSFPISKVTEQTWRVQNCPTMVHVQAVGSVRLPSEIYETQAAGLPESVGGTTVRICSPEQMNEPYKVVDVPDEHEDPKKECWKYLLTEALDSKQGLTDMSSFRETCTADTQQVYNWGPGPGPSPPEGPPPAALSQASSSKTVAPDAILQQSSPSSTSNTVAPDAIVQQRSPSSTGGCDEPPIKMQKLGREASAAEMVPEEDVQERCQSPTTPPGVPVTPPGLIEGTPSAADMTCPLMVARVAEEQAAKTADLILARYNWPDPDDQ